MVIELVCLSEVSSSEFAVREYVNYKTLERDWLLELIKSNEKENCCKCNLPFKEKHSLVPDKYENSEERLRKLYDVLKNINN